MNSEQHVFIYKIFVRCILTKLLDYGLKIILYF